MPWNRKQGDPPRSLDDYAEDLEELQDAVKKVTDAWTISDPSPLMHSLAVGALNKEWPELAIALDNLVKVHSENV